jgi:23S rRNA (cytidine2498-2'-O)-methyltransferase
MLTGYLAPENFEKDLAQEILLHPELEIQQTLERLIVVKGPEKELAFSQCTLKNLKKVEIASITDAAKILKSEGKLWTPYSPQLHRRMTLVQEKLPKVRNAPHIFGMPKPDRTLGVWTLIDANSMYYSAESSSPFPLGEITFAEDKQAPSRAYMKLWEYFTLTGQYPQKGETCMDLGSSPGGWTWVLSNLGANVISVDKAPLAPELQTRKNIRSLKKDAFTLKPEDVGPIDWLFSDIICYPARLLELVQEWQASGLVKNFVCTIKFQGETDFKTLQAFQAIPGSHTQHLFVNKHEVTWSQRR